MALENAVVLKNLKEQRTTIETQITDGQGQLDQLRATYLKLSGAIDVLEQIEGSNDPTPEVESGPETVIDEEEEESE